MYTLNVGCYTTAVQVPSSKRINYKHCKRVYHFQWGLKDFIVECNRLGSRFLVNETSQISDRHSDQLQAVM